MIGPQVQSNTYFDRAVISEVQLFRDRHVHTSVTLISDSEGFLVSEKQNILAHSSLKGT